jgi:HPt (histidine-containing phosphotransfer) domain-containing protein
MSKAGHLATLRNRLHQLEDQLAADKRRLAEGTPHEQVEAAGDMVVVEERIDETRRKIERLEAAPDTAWEDLKAEVDQDLRAVETAIERWITRHR